MTDYLRLYCMQRNIYSMCRKTVENITMHWKQIWTLFVEGKSKRIRSNKRRWSSRKGTRSEGKYVRTKGNWDSLSGIATGYWLHGRGSISGTGKRFSSRLHHLDRRWGPHSLLSNSYQGLFLQGEAAGEWSWQLPSSAEIKNGGTIPPNPTCLNDLCLSN
jgi:hypothetical protein